MCAPRLPHQKSRRCTRACENCRRRKVRCDGLQPCWPCLTRREDCSVVGRFVSVQPSKDGRHRKATTSRLKHKVAKPVKKPRTPRLSELPLPPPAQASSTKSDPACKPTSKTSTRPPILQKLADAIPGASELTGGLASDGLTPVMILFFALINDLGHTSQFRSSFQVGQSLLKSLAAQDPQALRYCPSLEELQSVHAGNAGDGSHQAMDKDHAELTPFYPSPCPSQLSPNDSCPDAVESYSDQYPTAPVESATDTGIPPGSGYPAAASHSLDSLCSGLDDAFAADSLARMAQLSPNPVGSTGISTLAPAPAGLTYCPADPSTLQLSGGLSWPRYEMIGAYGDVWSPNVEGLGPLDMWSALDS